MKPGTHWHVVLWFCSFWSWYTAGPNFRFGYDERVVHELVTWTWSWFSVNLHMFVGIPAGYIDCKYSCVDVQTRKESSVQSSVATWHLYNIDHCHFLMHHLHHTFLLLCTVHFSWSTVSRKGNYMPIELDIQIYDVISDNYVWIFLKITCGVCCLCSKGCDRCAFRSKFIYCVYYSTLSELCLLLYLSLTFNHPSLKGVGLS